MIHRKRLLTLALAAALISSSAAGCAVSSGRAAYTAHTNHRVSPGGVASPDMAMAFGLDGQRAPSGTVAQVDPH